MRHFLQTLKKEVQKYLPMIIIGLFVFSAAVSQFAYDRAAPPYSPKLKAVHRDLLPEKILPYSHFGFSIFLADIYWIRAIQDFVAWNGKEIFFLDYFKNISTLDPRFEQPYLFAIWTIPINKNDVDRLDKVAAVAERGIETIPTSWKIPYYLGTQYFLFTKSYDKAKDYLKIAAEKKDAPPGVYLNYSSFVINDIKGYRASYDLVKVIYDTTEDKILKKILASGLELELIRTMLERGIVAYKTTKGIYPSTVAQLTKENFITLPTSFSEKFYVTLNARNGSFKIEEKR